MPHSDRARRDRVRSVSAKTALVVSAQGEVVQQVDGVSPVKRVDEIEVFAVSCDERLKDHARER